MRIGAFAYRGMVRTYGTVGACLLGSACLLAGKKKVCRLCVRGVWKGSKGGVLLFYFIYFIFYFYFYFIWFDLFVDELWLVKTCINCCGLDRTAHGSDRICMEKRGKGGNVDLWFCFFFCFLSSLFFFLQDGYRAFYFVENRKAGRKEGTVPVLYP